MPIHQAIATTTTILPMAMLTMAVGSHSNII